MMVRSLRDVARMVLLTLVLAAVAGCNSLNPAFLNSLGIDAGSSGPTPTGSILLTLDNETTGQAILGYTVEYSWPGESTETNNDFLTMPSGMHWTVSFDCYTSVIQFTGLSIDGEDVDLKVNEFGPPALRCGSVIYVKIATINGTNVVTAEIVN